MKHVRHPMRPAITSVLLLLPLSMALAQSGTIDPRKAAAARRLLAHALPITIEPGRDGLEVHIAP